MGDWAVLFTNLFLLIAFSVGGWMVCMILFKRPRIVACQAESSLIEDNKKRYYQTLLLGIVGIVVLTRCLQFGSLPNGVMQDEAMAALDARALADYGTDRFGMIYPVHFTAWGYGQMSVLMSYCMIPFIKLFGFTLFAIRLPILLLSCAGLVVLYRFLMDVAGQKVALIGLLVAALSPWHIVQSRFALDCNFMAHILLIAFYLLYRGVAIGETITRSRNGRVRYHQPWQLYASMVFFAMTFYSYGIAVYSVPLVLVACAVYLLVKKKIRVRQLLLCVGVFVLIVLPEVVVLAINAFHLQPICLPFATLPYFPDTERSQDILFFHPIAEWPSFICGAFTSFVQYRLLEYAIEMPSDAVPGWNGFYLCFLPFIVAGIGYTVQLFRDKHRSLTDSQRFAAFLLLVNVGLIFWVGMTTGGVILHRGNMMMYPLLVLTVLGVLWFKRYFRQAIVVFVCCQLLLGACFCGCYMAYYQNCSDESGFYTDYVDALEYAHSLAPNRYYIEDLYYDSVPDTATTSSIELVTDFTLQIDSLYYRGVTDEFDGSVCPYRDKFRFLRPSEVNFIKLLPGDVLVVSRTRACQYDDKTMDIAFFGTMAAVREKT